MNKPISPFKYPELDGIRGAAFLWVMVAHIFGSMLDPYLLGVPKYGVWMFFVLSAFLLTNYFLTNPERAYRPVEWMNYLVRRFMRIFPLYAVVLIIFYFFQQDITSISMIKEHLLLQKGVVHFWTIPVEFSFYFLLPLIVLAIIWVFQMNIKITLLYACFCFRLRSGIDPQKTARN